MIFTVQNYQRNKFQKLTRLCYFNLEKCIMTITLIVFCIIFFPILIMDICRMVDNNKSSNTSEMNTTLLPITVTDAAMANYDAVPFDEQLLKSEARNCKYEGQGIVCCGLSAEDVTEQVNQLASDESSVIELQLKNLLETSFSNRSLMNLKSQVIKITIEGKSLTNIDSYAFSAYPFTENLDLTICGSNISNLKKDTFIQVKLMSFQFRSETRKELLIEEDVFGSTAQYLQVIQLNGFFLKAEYLKNLTSNGEILGGVMTLDLSYNTIPIIAKNSFSRLPNLKQIFLMGNTIKTIETGAFNGAFSLMLINLSNNALKTLPDKLFSSLTSLGVHIWTDGNPWICNCEMQWLKIYLMARNNTNDLMCNLEDGTYKSYLEVQFCTNESTTQRETATISPTTVPSSPSTLVPIANLENIVCTDASKLNGHSTNTSKTFLQDATLKINNLLITVIFYQNMDTPSYTLVVYSSENCHQTELLVWTNVYNESDNGCVYNFGKTSGLYVELAYDAIYTVCLATNYSEDPKILIRNCTAIKTSTEFGNQTWLANRHKAIVISLGCFCLLLSILVSVLLVYLIIRQHPELIKGNKRVLLVKQKPKSPSFLVMPNYYASVSNESDGYLTPKTQRYSKMKSSFESRQLYDIYEANKMLDSAYSADVVECYKESIYEPPPLPPNHPCERKSSLQPYFHSNM